ncbi:unnamed protein product, partial [Ectocarpus sp. 12 AP-2014]
MQHVYTRVVCIHRPTSPMVIICIPFSVAAITKVLSPIGGLLLSGTGKPHVRRSA